MSVNVYLFIRTQEHQQILKNNDFLVTVNKILEFRLTFMAYYLWIHWWEVWSGGHDEFSISSSAVLSWGRRIWLCIL